MDGDVDLACKPLHLGRRCQHFATDTCVLKKTTVVSRGDAANALLDSG
jgi:hypothetical protein